MQLQNYIARLAGAGNNVINDLRIVINHLHNFSCFS
ncbi:MAG: hypothetical protein JWR50_2825 [Mucilaginibacter sp.]|nr:hypothetical protein [Mucilaginibacter sp.]